MKTSRAKEFLDPEIELAGELKRFKRMMAAASKVFWLKRGSHDEGRDIAVNERVMAIRAESTGFV